MLRCSAAAASSHHQSSAATLWKDKAASGEQSVIMWLMFLIGTAGKNTWRSLTPIRRPAIRKRTSTLTSTQVRLQLLRLNCRRVLLLWVSRCYDHRHTFCLIDGAECNVRLVKPGQSVAARLLAVVEDLEQAHATFQRREKEDGASVILNP